MGANRPQQWEVDALGQRQTITVSLFSKEQYDSEWIPEKLSDAIAWLNGFLEQVPPEWRNSATIGVGSVGSYEDSHYAQIGIDYERPETDEEWAARRVRVEMAVRERDEIDRREFERLRAKFG